MLYLDEDYKIDCENKIKYDHLIEIQLTTETKNNYNNILFNIEHLYTDQDPENPILLVIGRSGFYTKNVKFCKEIGPNLYKVSVTPYVASKSEANRQYRTLAGN